MDTTRPTDRTGAPPKLGMILGSIALFAGVVTLAGWFAHIPRLTDWDADGIAMFPNAAIASVFAGTALVSLSLGGRRGVLLCRAFAGVTALICGATLAEHLFRVDLHIDTLLAPPLWGQGAADAPSRMGPPASFSFTALGAALLLATGPLRARRFVPRICLLVCGIALLGMLGYLFHADMLFALPRITGVASQTACLLLALALGVMAAVPDQPPFRTLQEPGSAGMLARTALPYVVALPIILAWLVQIGRRADLYDEGMGIALLVLSLIAVLCGLLWSGIRAVRAKERALLASERAAQARSREIEALNARLQRAMAETHHRVKNNLQVMSALVDMQVLDHEGAVPVAELARIGQHVRSLAAIHDLLTEQARTSRGTETVALREVVERLTPHLMPLLGHRQFGVKIEDIILPTRYGTSLAVLVNELVSNAVKHGGGDITVAVSKSGGRVRLDVRDCGDGFPAGFEASRVASTGLQLVESVARTDLQGSVEYRNRAEGGARVTVEFRYPGASGEPAHVVAVTGTAGLTAEDLRARTLDMQESQQMLSHVSES